MAAPLDIASYKDALVVLATAGVVVPFARRFKISAVVAFLAVGALVGPFALGRIGTSMPWVQAITVSNPDALTQVAELGVVFLLFVIGLELPFERLMTMRRLVFGLGAAQVMTATAVIGGAFWWAGQPTAAAIILGAALALSSTAIVVELLSEHRRMTSGAGRATFAVLLFQDIAVVPLLFLVTVLGQQQNGSLLAGLAQALLQAAIAIALIVVIGRLVLRPLFRLVAGAGAVENFIAATLLVAVGTGIAAAAAGLSMALGAFIAGLLLAETEYRRAIEVAIEPFKALLIGVFFLSVGMGLDLSAVLRMPVAIIGGAIVLIGVKAAMTFLLARGFRLSRSTAAETALLTGPGGEFAFVLVGAALAAGLVARDLATSALAAVSLTMFALPLMARMGRIIGKRLAPAVILPDEARILPPEDRAQRAIVVGCGRVGQLVADMLGRHKVAYLAADADPARVAKQRRAGEPAYFGDATQLEFLRACGLAEATALIVTIDNPRAVDEIVAAARGERADLVIVARARDAKHARHLYELGVNDAVPETIEASLQLSEAALVGLGVPMGLVIATVHQRRDEYRADLKPAASDAARPRRHARSRRL